MLDHRLAPSRVSKNETPRKQVATAQAADPVSEPGLPGAMIDAGEGSPGLKIGEMGELEAAAPLSPRVDEDQARNRIAHVRRSWISSGVRRGRPDGVVSGSRSGPAAVGIACKRGADFNGTVIRNARRKEAR
jgi:hypothetical protein